MILCHTTPPCHPSSTLHSYHHCIAYHRKTQACFDNEQSDIFYHNHRVSHIKEEIPKRYLFLLEHIISLNYLTVTFAEILAVFLTLTLIDVFANLIAFGFVYFVFFDPTICAVMVLPNVTVLPSTYFTALM